MLKQKIMILKRLLQKNFTDIKLVKNCGGLLFRSIEHVLKLKNGYNYPNDRSGHIKSIICWVKDVRKEINNDESSKGPEKVMELLLTDRRSEYNREYMIKQIQKDFRKDYDQTCVITEEDIDYAVDIITKCLCQKDDIEIRKLLEKEFKK